MNKHLTPKEQLFNRVCADTMELIWNMTLKQESIELYNFNIKDENHLAILFIAHYASFITRQKMKINLSYFKRKKASRLIAENANLEYCKGGNVDVNEVINRMSTHAAFGEFNFTFADIYNAFYKERRA